ncbi:Large proline-rich protein BAG6 [Morus notabilis]|uniref:Large proline-rich protein BAG6 n=1 Tax=Morus notabilis TaxID=981085 RepID=W9RF91_9ROSA|nr:Large proline-rich protein BAG6 [Morus notabilis]
MADQHSGEGSSTGNVSSMDSSDSNVLLNIKTLDSQIYSFQVDKNMPVSLFKEKIANEIGVPVGQQRLIFRGKVLKDDHHLSEYHVENGHTLHLVVRQQAQSQDSSGTSAGETTGNNGNRVNDPSAGAPRGRVGQISHSVVLGTFNVGDQGEGGVPDLTRVIGAVLNSIGIGGQPMANVIGGMQSNSSSINPSTSPQGNGAGVHGNVGGQSQAGNQAQSGQAFPSQPFQSLPQLLQIPPATTAVPIPSLNTPIPGSLTTISEFMNRMDQALSQNGYQPNSSPNSTRDRPRVDLPSNAQGLHTPEALSIVLRQAEQLLSSHAVAALSAESIVNAGPAVYISPSGPNPIMVQPFPLQTSSLFSSVPPVNPMTFGSAGIGNAPRNINIHIHAGTSLAPIVTAVGPRGSNGDGLQGERPSGTGSTDSGVSRAIPVRNIIATAVPSRPSAVATSHAAQPGTGQAESNVQNSSTPVTRDVENEHHSTLAVSGDGESRVSLPRCTPQVGCEDTGVVTGSKEDLTCLDKGSSSSASIQRPEKCQDEDHKNDVPRSPEKHDTNEGAKAVPLGLGLGGLERKVRDGGPLGGQGSVGQVDMANVMSQVLHSPALNGLLSGVSEQTGVGSPDALRNMLQEFTQSPQMRNVVNQIAVQVDGQDVGSMFSAMGGQGGGMDFSRMFQQMMPIVSRALGATGSTPHQPFSVAEPQSPPQYSERIPDAYENNDQNLQDDLQSVAQRIEDTSSPEDVFRALVENSFRLWGGESVHEGLVDELCSDENLANEYLELLQNELRRRGQGGSE